MQNQKNTKLISFIGGDTGCWETLSLTAVAGETLAKSARLNIVKGEDHESSIGSLWTLKAVVSNLRYTNRSEKNALDQNSRALGQPEYDYAALIPIKKSDEWWALTQDERRKIFEEDSQHIRISSKYLSMISRQLHHCRDLGEPFDFLTWFEFSSGHAHAFDELLNALRKTEEWKFVTREIDIRFKKVM
jgi:chlorite dismutase